MNHKQQKHRKPLFVFVSQNWVSLCSPDCPRTHSKDQDGLELIEPPASAS